MPEGQDMLKRDLARGRKLEERFTAEGIETTVSFLSDPAKFMVALLGPDVRQDTAKLRALAGIESVEMTPIRDPRVVWVVVQAGVVDAH